MATETKIVEATPALVLALYNNYDRIQRIPGICAEPASRAVEEKTKGVLRH